MSRTRLLFSLILVVVGLTGVVPARAQSEAPIEVVAVKGPLDGLAVDFIDSAIVRAARRGAEVVILQLDTPGALTPNVADLVDLVADPPLPVVVWVGPDPAAGYGATMALLEAAAIGAAAPGVEVGYRLPLVAGDPVPAPAADAPADPLVTDAVTVRDPIPPYVDVVVPTINNLLVALNGRVVTVRDQTVTLETTAERDGAQIAKPTVFLEPGLGTRTLRLAVRPEAAFFFLVAGLTIAAFEFFAIGPGVAAGVAVLSLLLSGYGLAVLPLRWWAVLLALLGQWLMTVDFQRGAVGALTGLGAVAMTLGGLFFTSGAPQIVPAWWAVIVIVVSVVLFYMFAMTAVARSRFSTPTLGREHLIGRRGKALTDFNPNGEVNVDGARWLAAAHREAGIRQGDAVVVAAIDGRFLEVEPVDPSN